MRKILKAFMVGMLVLVILFTLSSCGKSQIIGTWYYEDDPDSSLTIYENNEAKRKLSAWKTTDEYDYTYEKGILTFYYYGFKEYSYVVKVKGDKMLLTSGEKTEVLYNSYEKACEASGIDYEAMQEIEELEIKPAMDLVVWDDMINNMPYPGEAEKYLLNEGYDNYFYIGKEEDLEGENYGYRNVRFKFNIYFPGDVEAIAYVVYIYEDNEWSVKELEFEEEWGSLLQN